ncbi:hypothetical protein J2X31_003503 [Flavobacterium arsenatis]|uniref:Lipoprotein n=1 Tax=Flavobacterium arsenatis TaxID=1484332 RepID=A0ABU1TUB6_9FLAO|nr:hypothetical protein [Flavobacterium arsenatis]MDR6969472.1 hypothetical protein [Flavobacterium arsenatis]
MKNLKSYYRLLIVLALVFTAFGCESDDEGDDIENDPSSSFEGSWKRENMETYVKFVGSNAITCSGGVETVGSFNASEPSMTFVIGQEVIKFPLKINGNALLVGVPNQAVETHNAQIYYRSNVFPCDGSGGGGSGEGNIMFWIGSDLGCGNISVTLQGQGSGSITSYYGSSPNCGASGCANFTVAPGTYSYTASCGNYTWNGTITVPANQCYKMQLTL